ncbi:MAG: carbon-nitrogen hydrolase family protein [Candidatus Xenobia bacterium]
MKIAVVQFRPPKGEPDVARPALCARVDEAGQAGARIIVCPEMAVTGYVWRDAEEVRGFCEPACGPTYHALQPLARRYQAWIVCGFAERKGDRLYNSALVVGPGGGLVACYRKVLLYPADRTWCGPGLQRVLVETEWGRLAPAICMDLNDDEMGAWLVRHRPRVVAFCTNWIDQGRPMLDYWRSRLFGWEGWFMAANTWGRDRDVPFYGRSAILAPGGAVAAMAPPRGDVVLTADIAE